MPFVSNRDNRELMQSITPVQREQKSSFYDVFSASVGLVFDEELSISGALNREGWEQRRQLVTEKIANGEIDKSKYFDKRGRFNYDRLARDLNDPLIKTDAQLTEERNEILAHRREYAQDVIERGSGMAQFIGSATGYILDPINVATMPIATIGTASRGMTAIGKALTIGRNEAGLALATELAIQPLVYEHKDEIESPYGFDDALTNIATAAVGAGALGAFTGGLSGYFRKVKESTQDLPQVIADKDATASLEVLDRVAHQLDELDEGGRAASVKASEETAIQEITQEIDQEIIISRSNLEKAREAEKVELSIIADELDRERLKKITRGETKEIQKEIQTLNERINKLDQTHDYQQLAKDQLGPKAKSKQVKKRASEIKERDAKGINARKRFLENQLKLQEAPKLAEADLSRLKQGIIPDRFKQRIEEAKAKAAIEHDVDVLRTLESKRLEMDKPSQTPSTYQEESVPKSISSRTATERQRAVLESQGVAKDFDMDLAKFEELDNPLIVQGDEVVNANEFMKSIDDELEGLESVLRCTIG